MYHSIELPQNALCVVTIKTKILNCGRIVGWSLGMRACCGPLKGTMKVYGDSAARTMLRQRYMRAQANDTRARRSDEFCLRCSTIL